MTPEQALNTYDMTKKNCLPDEFPEWVAEVDRCLMSGEEPTWRFAEWVPQVLKVVRERKQISMADEIK